MKVWESDNITLICCDCLEAFTSLGQKIDATITDPPYGVGLGKTSGTGGAHGLKRAAYGSHNDSYDTFVNDVIPRLNAAIDISDRAAIFTGPHIHEQRKPDAIGGIYASAAAGRHKWGFKNFLPVLFYGTAPELHKGAKYPTAISSNARAAKVNHPCRKPDAWMEWLINLASRPGQTILDPFMGSGTTGEACARLGRRFIGIEKDEAYFDEAVERMKLHSKKVLYTTL